jgi:hypothetical protein
MEHGGGVNLSVGRNMKWALRACTRSYLEADGGYERSGLCSKIWMAGTKWCVDALSKIFIFSICFLLLQTFHFVRSMFSVISSALKYFKICSL